jgi:hypothetical protein
MINFSRLNRNQKEKLSNYFIDVSKALLAATIGFNIIDSKTQLVLRLCSVIFNFSAAIICLIIGLDLTNQDK